MNEKIIVRFIRDERYVFMRCLEMPEIYRGRGTLIQSSDCVYSVKSQVCPAITSTELYLRGDSRQLDDVYNYYCFDSKEAAQEAIKNWTALIRKLNDQSNEEAEDKDLMSLEVTIAE